MSSQNLPDYPLLLDEIPIELLTEIIKYIGEEYTVYRNIVSLSQNMKYRIDHNHELRQFWCTNRLCYTYFYQETSDEEIDETIRCLENGEKTRRICLSTFKSKNGNIVNITKFTRIFDFLLSHQRSGRLETSFPCQPHDSDVHSLSLTKIPMNHHMILQVKKIIEKIKTIHELTIYKTIDQTDIHQFYAYILFDALKENTTITSLDFHYNYLKNEAIECLARSLIENTTIQCIDLSGNHMRDEGMIHIANMLKVNRSIYSINLENNKFTSHGIIELAKAIYVNPVLESIDLSGHRINTEAFNELLKSISVQNRMKSISMYNCELNEKKIQLLSEFLKQNTSVQTLDLDDNNIGDNGAKMIADALKVNHTLLILHIKDTQIGDKGAEYIADGIRMNSTLQQIHMPFNVFDEIGAMHLIRAIQSRRNILDFSIYYGVIKNAKLAEMIDHENKIRGLEE
jgi:Ran GTPase-activating protein (RanGAP) involved in mRNA processing and transport